MVTQVPVLATLHEMAERGGAEQARAARELIAQVVAGVPGAQAAAQQLADAYLNDPYLTRNPGDR
jgi:hypothetical protein